MAETSTFLEATALFWESIKDFKASRKVKFGIAEPRPQALPYPSK
jgi:hypothetical protein